MWSSQNNSAQQTNVSNLRTLGMTSAISMAVPKPSDLSRTSELEDALKPFDVFETEQELNHRMVILSKLYLLVKQWIKSVSIAKNMPENVAENVGGKIYTFGSYRLGVCTENLVTKLECFLLRMWMFILGTSQRGRYRCFMCCSRAYRSS